MKWTWIRQNALALVLLILCAALTVALFRRGNRAVPLVAQPAVAVGHDLQPAPAKEDSRIFSRVIPELDLPDQATYQEAFDAIARAADCRIDVNWTGLRQARIERFNLSELTGHFHNITLGQAIARAIGQHDIGYTAENGVVFIDHAQSLSRYAVTRVYNVRDILDAAAVFWAAGAAVSDADRAAAMDLLMRTITDSVSSDSWHDNGGAVGGMNELLGLLTITQTPENHQAIADLLDSLRQTSHLDPEKAYLASAETAPPSTQPVDAVEIALSRMLPQLPTEPPRTLSDALSVMQGAIRQPMFVDWKALEIAGVERNEQLKIDWPLRQMSNREAINLILRSIAEPAELIVTRQGGSTIITSESELPKYTVQASYNIRDLIHAEMQHARDQAGDSEVTETPKEAAEQITRTLIDFIDPPSWRDNGGNVGRLNEVMGLLFVQQTPENQDAVRKMLDTMRAGNVAGASRGVTK